MNPRRQWTSPFREWRRKQAYNILPMFSLVGSLLVRGIGITMRTRYSGHLPILEMVKSGDPFILAFLHGRQFLLIYQLQGWPFAIMTSISYMGEIQSRILNSFGYATIRGSRSRGGARVLAKMVGLVRKGRIGAFAVDGPRGPYGEVKPGAVFAAKKLGVPVVPVSTSARHAIVLDSVWDRFFLPLPFARATIHLGKPIFFDSDLSDEAITQGSRQVGLALEKLEAEADAVVGRTRK